MLEIGEILREARLSAGLEASDVESETMIPSRYVGALESERFEVIPVGPYRRSFLGEYADFLGLDGAALCAEFDRRFAPSPEPVPPAPPLGRRLEEVVRRTSPGWIGAAVAAVAVVIVVWHLGSGGGGAGVPRPPVAAPAEHALRPPSRPKAATITTRPQGSGARRSAVGPPAPRAAGGPLVLTAARGSCWLEVRIGSAAGTLVYQHTLSQGQSVRFGLGEVLWLRLGAPWNIVASIGGRPARTGVPASTGNALVTVDGFRPAP